MKSRPVTPMSLMTDVFVELERLTQSLERLRDQLTVDDRHFCSELFEVRYHCRKIIEGIRSIASLLSVKLVEDEKPEAPKPSRPTLIKS